MPRAPGLAWLLGVVSVLCCAVEGAAATGRTLDRPLLHGGVAAYGGYTAWAAGSARGTVGLRVARGGRTRSLDIGRATWNLDPAMGAGPEGRPTLVFSACPGDAIASNNFSSGLGLDATGAGTEPPAGSCRLWSVDVGSGARQVVPLALAAGQSAIRPALRGATLAFALVTVTDGGAPQWRVAVSDLATGQIRVLRRLGRGFCGVRLSHLQCGLGPAKLALGRRHVFVRWQRRTSVTRYRDELLAVRLRDGHTTVIARASGVVGQRSPQLIGPAVDGGRVYWLRSARRVTRHSVDAETLRRPRRAPGPRYPTDVVLKPIDLAVDDGRVVTFAARRTTYYGCGRSTVDPVADTITSRCRVFVER